LRVPPIYAITDRKVSGIDDIPEIARRLLRVGVRWIQVREKELSDVALLSAVEATAELARAEGATVLVNDRVDVARVAGVGVHLGEEDLAPALARELLLPGRPLGVSTHDSDAAGRAFEDPNPDYVAFGPVFESGTKRVRPPRGLEELARIAAGKTRPLVAIGGITPERLESVWDAGADSAAMIGGLLAGGRIEQNARRALDRARRRSCGRIYLVGFMGAGKTALGRRIAERLEVPFVDLDAEIERISGVTIRAFFETQGEAAFRGRESAFLEGTASLDRVVVATGGGAFTREENRRVIDRLGASVFLEVPFTQLAVRLSGKTDRPLFHSLEQARALLAEREPAYSLASVRVPLAGTEPIEEAADRVLCALDRLKPA
jgi:thiamine-phosphate pyrophosphorylase